MQIRSTLPPGVDGWGLSLKGMMSMVVLGGAIVGALYWYLNQTVVKRQAAALAAMPKKSKKPKNNMGLVESFTFLANSSYIRDMAMLVINDPLYPSTGIRPTIFFCCVTFLKSHRWWRMASASTWWR